MRMELHLFGGFYGFTVLDMATGTTVAEVQWVDDSTMEYATTVPAVLRADGFWEVTFGWTTHKVTAVRVDYVNKRIEVNTPAAQASPWPFPTSQGKQCDACCQPDTCKRIDFCAAYRCRFGQDSKP
jgi:hypothetical protein